MTALCIQKIRLPFGDCFLSRLPQVHAGLYLYLVKYSRVRLLSQIETYRWKVWIVSWLRTKLVWRNVDNVFLARASWRQACNRLIMNSACHDKFRAVGSSTVGLGTKEDMTSLSFQSPPLVYPLFRTDTAAFVWVSGSTSPVVLLPSSAISFYLLFWPNFLLRKLSPQNCLDPVDKVTLIACGWSDRFPAPKWLRAQGATAFSVHWVCCDIIMQQARKRGDLGSKFHCSAQFVAEPF